ncbi:dicarboxylate/amino acid:cation symporter [Megasphaera vaginalis (ex Bordigoni et al. 2020)]|uniref:dicarboxylate/amino acid:cation symporter n=1 Tax=Megasphaera vaginalis (ex Bordigoni et al. 2020) TaxID=2045301 RepID=UPI000C7BABCF|nr:dicarboxylate/amino acid:cation symporter [Megasphaera vaginalis (ex Bordigoni et al. 2020)]
MNNIKLGLGTQILMGIIVGFILGFSSPALTKLLSPLGTVFLRMLKMLIVPLVFFSITNGICKMGNVKQLVTVGGRFMLYIVVTSGLCAALGALVGMGINLGGGTTEFLMDGAQVKNVDYNFINNVVSWFPENIVDAMVKQDMLQIIVFAMFLGVAILSLGKKVESVVKLIDNCTDIMLKITDFVIAFSPVGIASLMATMVTTISGATVKDVIALIVADYVTAIFVLIVMYPLILKVLAGLGPITFFRKITEPMIVAVTTTSSAATLPVSLRTVGTKLGIPENIYGFTLPLGNTCGMNGFAIFIGLCCVFCSHIYGIEITFAKMILYIFLGIILSIGAAGVKGAGIVMSTVLLQALGMPLSVIPIIAAIWPVIDPAHTLLNNTSDIVGTAVIAKRLGKMDMSTYEQ